MSPVEKKTLTLAFLIFSSLRLIWCLPCATAPSNFYSWLLVKESFWQGLGAYFWELFPLIMVALFLASVLERITGRFSRWLPRNTLAAAGWAMLLPVCSCAAVPLTACLREKIPARACFTFLVIVPLVNPFVLILGTAALGWRYTLFRVAGSLILGLTAGWLLEKLTATSPEKTAASYSPPQISVRSDSLLVTTWESLAKTWPFLLSGIFLGSLVSWYLPSPFLQTVFAPDLTGLFLTTAAAIPLFLCSGQEIPILKPFLNFGLPMGHAIAFTLAGNGICLTSLPLLISFFDRKTTFWFVVLIFLGSFLIGASINLLAAVVAP